MEIAGERVDLDASVSNNEEGVRITAEGKAYHVLFQAISDNHYHLIVDGRATEAYVVQGDQGKHIFVNGQSFLVQDADRLIMHRTKRRRSEEVPREVTPPMPSVVVRILVQEGDYVKKGQGLIVVTAMKMETTLMAPKQGRVKKINTFVNAKVSPGDHLVEMEAGEQGDR
ncbi:MAG: biotin/lipoyl-containing protein [Pseudomonadota bacterium]